MTTNKPPTRRRIWLRLLLGMFGLALLVVATMFLLIVRNARRPSPVRPTLTAAEVAGANDSLRALGLIVPPEGVYKEHPFSPPWTATSLMIPHEWNSGGEGLRLLFGRKRVRASALRADLDVLEPVMQRAYGGWDLAAARGWKWDAWFAAWRSRLEAVGDADLHFDEAFAPVDSLLAFQPDNHTQIPNSRWTSSGSQSAILDRSPGGECTAVRTSRGTFSLRADDAGTRVRRALRWQRGSTVFDSAFYVAMPTARGVPKEVQCGTAWIPLVLAGKRSSSSVLPAIWGELFPSDPPHAVAIGEGVIYARLPTMNAMNYQDFDSKTQVQPSVGDRVLVVDLRNNLGGGWGYGFGVIAPWIDQSRLVQLGNMSRRVGNSCLYAALTWGREGGRRGERSQQLINQMLQPHDPECPRSEVATPGSWNYQMRRFAPTEGAMRIVALVNSRCGSDCELITALLASLPETIVVGVNTYGVAQFIQPGYSVLPHTGLTYRIATGSSDQYGDNRSMDGYGLDVDVVVREIDKLSQKDLVQLAKAVLAGRPSGAPRL